MSPASLHRSIIPLLLLGVFAASAQPADADKAAKAKALLKSSLFGPPSASVAPFECAALLASNETFRLATPEGVTVPQPWSRLPPELDTWHSAHPKARAVSVVKAQTGVPRATLERAAKALTAAGITPRRFTPGQVFTASAPTELSEFTRARCDEARGELIGGYPSLATLDEDLVKAVSVPCPAQPASHKLNVWLAETCGRFSTPHEDDLALMAERCAESPSCAGPCAAELARWQEAPEKTRGLKCEAFRQAARSIPAEEAPLAVYAWTVRRLSCLVTQATRANTPEARMLTESCAHVPFHRAALGAR